MFTESRVYVKKFISSLFTKQISQIPFGGADFDNGIKQMNSFLRDHLKEMDYILISDLFEVTPVQEHYDNMRDIMMSLNGESIKFSAVDNPYWKRLSIELPNKEYAEFILADTSVLNIDPKIIGEATDTFCKYAKVEIKDGQTL